MYCRLSIKIKYHKSYYFEKKTASFLNRIGVFRPNCVKKVLSSLKLQKKVTKPRLSNDMLMKQNLILRHSWKSLEHKNKLIVTKSISKIFLFDFNWENEEGQLLYYTWGVSRMWKPHARRRSCTKDRYVDWNISF